jgi:lysophospholipase L1-like esterase
MGILPRRDYEVRIFHLNQEIAQLAGDLKVKYLYIGSIFITSQHKIDETLFSDGLHPNAVGYLKMREKLLPIFK